ncbi:6-hydroxymethylpterin diphosphokinase MptE-like protein [Shewanella baltica]|uniref:motility associated factor glycosyltransferase family protein n=1 Tax=Shewanella baltica TaxID=62322 RepID=UPI003D7B65CE
MQLPHTSIMNTFAVSRFDEVYLPSINRNTFENLNSKTLYDKVFTNILTEQDKLYIFIGLDSGLLPNYLLSQNIADGAQYVFVELPEVLALLNIELEPEKQKYIQIMNPEKFEHNLDKGRYRIFITKGLFEVHLSLGASSHHIEAYNELTHQLKDAVNKSHFQEQKGFNQQMFVNKQLANIAENRFPASVLKGQFKNKTCVIVAGGPSLDTHIDWLKQNSSNFIIIAVSRIAAKLHQYGIPVDIVVCIDPNYISFDVSQSMFKLPNDTLLVQSYHACPAISAQWPGPILYMGNRFPWIQKDDADNIQSIGPTVSNSAINLAVEMGFNRIFLSGVDLCYSKTGLTHANGTLEANVGPNLGRIREWVETYEGFLAETPIQMLEAIKDLENQITPHTHIHFYNLSSAAAKVKGIRYIPLNECQLTPLKNRIIKHIPPASFSPLNIVQRHADLIECKHKVTCAISDLNQILNETKCALNLTKNLTLNSISATKTINKINRIEQKLNREHSTLCQLIKFYGYFEFTYFLTSRNTDSWTQSHINQMTIQYYKAFEKTIISLLAAFHVGKNRLAVRLSELDPSTPLTVLADKWNIYKQPARSKFWKILHYDNLSTLSYADKILLTNLENDFKKQCQNISQYYERVLQKNLNINSILDKILILKSQKNVYGLNQLIQNLATQSKKNELIMHMYHLAKGFKLHLEGLPQEALDTLLNITPTKLTEIELREIILLAFELRNLTLASETLKKIIDYSDEYMPQFAHVQRLQGNHQAAINTYLDYLNKYPKDTKTWLKLGRFMFDINQAEAAHTAFSNALNAEPSNELARQYINELDKILNPQAQ